MYNTILWSERTPSCGVAQTVAIPATGKKLCRWHPRRFRRGKILRGVEDFDHRCFSAMPVLIGHRPVILFCEQGTEQAQHCLTVEQKPIPQRTPFAP
jgi:hypothetical protein